MKNALILHGLSDNSQVNWFPWLKLELEKIGYKVWVPDLPCADFPKQSTWCNYILNNKDWEFNEESIVIGHSSGAVATLGLIQCLPKVIKHAFLVAAFKDNLKYKGFKELDGLFEEPFDFLMIKKQVNNITFIHSTDDPYCPLEHASYLAVKTGGRLLIQSGSKHFSESTNPLYTKFPFLLELINNIHS